MSGIGKHLKHSVDIIYVTVTKGVRSTTITSDVNAFITEKTVVLKDELGDHFGTRHLIFLNGDVTLDEIDEIVIDGKQRPIINIFRARTKSRVVHHLEVEVR